MNAQLPLIPAEEIATRVPGTSLTVAQLAMTEGATRTASERVRFVITDAPVGRCDWCSHHAPLAICETTRGRTVALCVQCEDTDPDDLRGDL